MRPIWMVRVVRVVKPPKCSECGCRTEGGLLCDVCGQELIERTRASQLTRTGPHPM